MNVGLYLMAERAAEAVRLGALRVCPAGCVEAPLMVGSGCGFCIVTWRCRVVSSVRVAETTTPGGISSAINLAVAGNRADAIGACVVPTF